MEEELWADLERFPTYRISSLGRVYNTRTEKFMSISKTLQGHPKVSLMSGEDRHTVSVGRLVALQFVTAPTVLCDQIMALNGDREDLRASNLAWRPHWFVWKYVRQLKEEPRRHYVNLPVLNIDRGIKYNNIVEASIAEGLLFEDVWRSTYTGNEVFPHGHIFEVIERV